jgi:hypothetical protein
VIVSPTTTRGGHRYRESTVSPFRRLIVAQYAQGLAGSSMQINSDSCTLERQDSNWFRNSWPVSRSQDQPLRPVLVGMLREGRQGSSR